MVKNRKQVAVMLTAVGVMAISSVAMAADAPAAGGMTAQTLIFHILDWVVILVLVAASIAGVALAIDAALHIREIKIAPPATTEQLKTFISNRQFKELMEYTASDQTFVSQALNAGLRRAHLGYAAMREAMETSAGEQTANYFRRIEMLNVIGNIGPLVGLLGTVLGMIIAFYELNAAGGAAEPGRLAGGISTALWHTFGGLFVAIPCLVVFGLYRTKTDKITARASIVAEELLESLRPGEKPVGTVPAPAAQPAPRTVAPAVV